MISRGAFVALACLATLTACRHSDPDSKSPPPPPAESSGEEDAGPKRVLLTRSLVEKYKITQAELADLQLYLRGRVVLRREADSSMREVTEEHTLRVVDDRAHDDLVVEPGTPGIFLSVEDERLLVNFDHAEPEVGLVFEAARTDAFLLRVENDPAVRGGVVHYGDATYRLVQGTGASLELDTEKLDALVTRERKLPGNLLSPGSAEPEPEPAPSGG